MTQSTSDGVINSFFDEAGVRSSKPQADLDREQRDRDPEAPGSTEQIRAFPAAPDPELRIYVVGPGAPEAATRSRSPAPPSPPGQRRDDLQHREHFSPPRHARSADSSYGARPSPQ